VVTDQSIPEDGAKYMRKVLEKGEGREVVEALYEAVGRNPFVVTHRNNFSQTAHTVWSYNDSAIRTHEEILTLLDKAIATEAVKLKDAAHEHITA
jgi:TfoX/Sxy family transcriptional regulator of competence genes